MSGHCSESGWRPEELGAGSKGLWGDRVEKPETWEEGNRFSFFRAPVLQSHGFGGRKMAVTFVLRGRGALSFLFLSFFYFFFFFA